MKNKTALGIAYLYTVLVSVFFLFSRTSLFIYGTAPENRSYFLTSISLQVITVAVLITVLYSLNKKQNQTLAGALIENPVRKTVGLILFLNCSQSLTVSLPSVFKTIQTLAHDPTLSGDPAALKTVIIVSGISFLFLICQLLLGLYMFRHKGKSPAREQDDYGTLYAVSGTVLLYFIITFVFELLSRIVSILFLNPSLSEVQSIIVAYIWWLIVSAGIICGLIAFNRKQNLGSASVFKDEAVCTSVGLLIIIDGLLSFSAQLPKDILNHMMLSLLYGTGHGAMKSFLLLLISVVQVLWGLYLLKRGAPKDAIIIEQDDSVSKD